MGTPLSVALSAFVACFTGLAVGVSAAHARQAASEPFPEDRVTQLASATTGFIAGQVLDERGQPLADVVVSAVGGSTSFAVTDGSGQFTLRALTPGPYLVRAHLDGYVTARRTIVNVRPAARTVSTFTLRRSGSADAAVLTAGVSGTDSAAADASDARDDGEIGWRLRHLKRSILRDSALASLPDDDWFLLEPFEFLGRAVESSARLAGAFFARSPLQAQVNLLTTGAFNAPGDLLHADRMGAVALVAVGAPVGEHGDWNVAAALNQGDLSSWLLSGHYQTRGTPRHRYQFGMSYGVHRYQGGNAAALAAMPETARNVGAVHGRDEWRVTDRLSIGYGGHYAHYDYLSNPAHFSPRVSATIRAARRTEIRAVATRRVAAPGAEEFLVPSRTEVLPPQRTFAPLTRDGFVPEDVRHYEVAVDQVLDHATLSVRAFRQTVDDQLVTLFGLRDESARSAEIGHYFVGRAGDVSVTGWGVTVSRAVGNHVRGSVAYSMAAAAWGPHQASLDHGRLARSMPSALREGSERVHDLTTSLETEVPQSATRVFVLYKMNNGYVGETAADNGPALDGRWDLQVNQGLPFLKFSRTEWEMLLAVRNLFRESFEETSIYDELLVARPPTRLVGGITVKF